MNKQEILAALIPGLVVCLKAKPPALCSSFHCHMVHIPICHMGPCSNSTLTNRAKSGYLLWEISTKPESSNMSASFPKYLRKWGKKDLARDENFSRMEYLSSHLRPKEEIKHIVQPWE